MNEGKVIKIMSRQPRELVGVLQSVRVELALFQRCGFPSSELRMCLFWLYCLAEAFGSQRQQSVSCQY